MNIDQINADLEKASPLEIIEWALQNSKKPVITTNFRPYEGAILFAVNRVVNDIPVIWCDTGYNTSKTYAHANSLIDQLQLNIKLYVPKQTSAYRDIKMGIPQVDSPEHDEFTNQVKIEPFLRALEEQKPDLWFTNIRRGQTNFRDKVNVVSKTKDGIIKVSPFYNWSDLDLDTYLLENKIPNEFSYFDPTKVLENRECGIHKL